jgi:hypothetical protein
MRKVFHCAWCFEANEIDVDLSAGDRQVYVEDCQVCCHPNTIRVVIDEAERRVTVQNEAEG